MEGAFAYFRTRGLKLAGSSQENWELTEISGFVRSNIDDFKMCVKTDYFVMIHIIYQLWQIMDAYSILTTHTLGCFKHMHQCIKIFVRLLSCVETPRTSQQCPTFSLEYSDDGRSLKPTQVSNGCAVGWWNYNLWQTLRNFQKCARFSQKFGALLQSLHEHDLQMIHQNKLK